MNNMKLITVYLKRCPRFDGHTYTIIYNNKECTDIKSIIPHFQTQPDKRRKTITINCFKFACEFIN